MGFKVLGMGTAVPPHRITQEAAAELAQQVICKTQQQARVLTALFQKSGVRSRYSVLPPQIALNWIPSHHPEERNPSDAVSLGPTTGERMQFFADHASHLGEQAALRAIANAGVDPRQITHLVIVCCTGFSAPGVDLALIESLNLRPTTQRIQIGFMGCHAAMNGLGCAHALATADPKATVLVCAVELCSLHYRFNWDPPKMVANALFGDGAAAVLGIGSDSEAADDWTLAATASAILPDSKEAMTWRIGDHGFEMTLAATVPDLIREHLRGWLSSWLDQHGASLDSVASWAIHPGGPRILQACIDALGLSRDQVSVSDDILAEFGNMSSPTVLFIVDRLRATNSPRPCVSLAFGPGLTAEAALFR
jgi:predicted naringenin-chalcone synthase